MLDLPPEPGIQRLPPSDRLEEVLPPPKRRRRWPWHVAMAVLAVLGLGGIGGGGFFLFKELTRKPTAAELEVAAEREVALRWRNWPAEKIFPPVLTYEVWSVPSTVRRIGIAPEAGCVDSMDRQAGELLMKHQCRAVLRATYMDATGSVVMTLGIAVMPTDDAAQSTAAELIDAKYGVRAVGFPGTMTERFGDAQRQLHASTNMGPYVVLAAGGYRDGRATMAALDNEGFLKAVGDARSALAVAIGKPLTVCRADGVRC